MFLSTKDFISETVSKIFWIKNLITNWKEKITEDLDFWYRINVVIEVDETSVDFCGM